MVKKDIKNCNYTNGAIIIWDLLNPQKINGNSKIDYNLSYVVLKSREQSLMYQNANSIVIYYILEGNGIIHINEEKEKIYPVQVIFIPPNSIHYLENTEKIELMFIKVVYPIKCYKI